MTVKELIKALQELDQELPVCFEWDNETLDIYYVIETFETYVVENGIVYKGTSLHPDEYNKLEKIVERKVILR